MTFAISSMSFRNRIEEWLHDLGRAITTRGDASANRSERRALTTYFAFVLAVIELYHIGNRSPYGYAWSVTGQRYLMNVEGFPINPDFHPNEPIFNLFYQPMYGDFSYCPNVNVPIHAFIASVFVGATRSLVVGHLIANFVVALALLYAYSSFALSRGLRMAPIAMAGTIVLMLPYYAQYLGQPMQYIIGPSLTFLVVLAVMVIERRRERGDVRARFESSAFVIGLLAAFLMLNYDSYVALASIGVYFIFLGRRSIIDWLIFAATTYVPVKLWRHFIPSLGTPNDPKTWDIGRWITFTKTPIETWTKMWHELDQNVTKPWAIAQVGWNIFLSLFAAYFYWFLLLAFGYYGLRERRRTKLSGPDRIVPLIVGAVIALELFTGAFDIDNNPRRVLPLVFVFAWIVTWVVTRSWSSVVSRLNFAGLAIVAFFHSFADTIFHKPTFAVEQTQQAIAGGPKFILGIDASDLSRASLRYYPEEGHHKLFAYPTAIWAKEFATPFVYTQLAMFTLVTFVVYMLVRTELLPRWSARVWGILYVASLAIRFV